MSNRCFKNYQYSQGEYEASTQTLFTKKYFYTIQIGTSNKNIEWKFIKNDFLRPL